MTRKKKILLFLFSSGFAGFGLLLLSTSGWGTQAILLPLVRKFGGINIQADELRLFRGHTLETKGLRLELPEVAGVSLEEGILDLEILPLLKKEYRIRSLHLKDPRIELRSKKNTEKSSDSAANESTGTSLSLKDIQILEGSFTLPLGEEDRLGLSKVHLRSASCETDNSCGIDGEVHISTKDLDADILISAQTRFNKFFRLESFSLKLDSPKLHFVRPEARIEEGTLKVEVSGKEPLVGSNRLNVQWTGLQWQAHKNPINGEFESLLSDLSGNIIGFQETRLRLRNESEEVLSIKTTGEFDKAKKHLQIGLDLETLKSPLFRFFATPLGPVEHLAIHGTAKADLEFLQHPQGALQARVSVDELSLANSAIQGKNLSQSLLELQAELKEDEYEVKALKLELQKDGKSIYDLDGGLGIKLPLKLQAHLHTTHIDVEALQSLQQQSTNPVSEQGKEKQQESAVSLASVPPIQLDYTIDRIKDKLSEVQKAHFEFASRKETEKRTSLHGRLRFLADHAPVESTFSAACNEGEPLEFASHFSTSRFPISFLLTSLGKRLPAGKPGEIERVDLELKGKGRFASEIKKSLQGDFQLSSQKNQLPSSIQDLFPFNLIFLPLGVVADITGHVTGFLVPDSLSSLATDLKKNLNDQGAIVLDETNIELELKDEKVTIKKGLVSPDLLPGIEYTGTVGMDGDLDLRVFLKILGIRTPLPITGTTSLPLPNVVRFIPELVKGLGLSALDVVEGVGSVFESKSSKKKK